MPPSAHRHRPRVAFGAALVARLRQGIKRGRLRRRQALIERSQRKWPPLCSFCEFKKFWRRKVSVSVQSRSRCFNCRLCVRRAKPNCGCSPSSKKKVAPSNLKPTTVILGFVNCGHFISPAGTDHLSRSVSQSRIKFSNLLHRREGLSGRPWQLSVYTKLLRFCGAIFCGGGPPLRVSRCTFAVAALTSLSRPLFIPCRRD